MKYFSIFVLVVAVASAHPLSHGEHGDGVVIGADSAAVHGGVAAAYVKRQEGVETAGGDLSYHHEGQLPTSYTQHLQQRAPKSDWLKWVLAWRRRHGRPRIPVDDSRPHAEEGLPDDGADSNGGVGQKVPTETQPGDVLESDGNHEPPTNALTPSGDHTQHLQQRTPRTDWFRRSTGWPTQGHYVGTKAHAEDPDAGLNTDIDGVIALPEGGDTEGVPAQTQQDGIIESNGNPQPPTDAHIPEGELPVSHTQHLQQRSLDKLTDWLRKLLTWRPRRPDGITRPHLKEKPPGWIYPTLPRNVSETEWSNSTSDSDEPSRDNQSHHEADEPSESTDSNSILPLIRNNTFSLPGNITIHLPERVADDIKRIITPIKHPGVFVPIGRRPSGGTMASFAVLVEKIEEAIEYAPPEIQKQLRGFLRNYQDLVSRMRAGMTKSAAEALDEVETVEGKVEQEG